MNTAYPIESPASTGLAHRIRATVAAWTPAARRPITREELASQHEQRREAERRLADARNGVLPPPRLLS